jgi:hypothetical protein
MSPTVPGLAFKARYLDRGEQQADRIDLKQFAPRDSWEVIREWKL